MPDKKYTILIVDDDDFLLDIYATKFTRAGHTVETASDGEGALENLREEESIFDAILLDIVMPSMDGLALLEVVRKEKLAKNAAVIVLSNQGQQEDIDKAKQYDIDGYIVKARTIPSEVQEEVVRIIEKKQSS